MQITYSNDVLVEKVIIRNNDGPSTDGIDIDSSTNVRVYEWAIWPVVMIVLLLGLAEMAMVQESIENHQESRLLDVKIRSGYGVTIW